MSPILVRPVREQLEHDRIIRLLHSKSRRKYDAGMNPGAEQNVPVGVGPSALYPDLVLHSQERGRRLEVIVEVETGESVNHLEALAQWTHLARVRAAFHLYVPSSMVDVARRLCEDNQIVAHEVWSYHSIGDDVRFTLINRSKELPVYGPPTRRPDEPSPKVPAVKASAGKAAAPKAAAPKVPVKSVVKAKAPAPSKPGKAITPVKKKSAPVAPAKRPIVKKKAAPAAKRPAVTAKRPVASTNKRPVAPMKKKAAAPRRAAAAPAKKKATRPTKRK